VWPLLAGVAVTGTWSYESLAKCSINQSDTIAVSTYPLLLTNERIAFIVIDVEAQSSQINVPVSPDEERTKHRLGQEIQDTVEHGLGVGSNEVTTFADTPCNGVEDPEERGQGATHHESALDIAAVVASVDACFPDKLIDNVGERDTTYDHVSIVAL
jgi:hypothetical protein